MRRRKIKFPHKTLHSPSFRKNHIFPEASKLLLLDYLSSNNIQIEGEEGEDTPSAIHDYNLPNKLSESVDYLNYDDYRYDDYTWDKGC
jgi:hypothetical protein